MSAVSLSALLADCQGLDIYEQRENSKEYMEIVVFSADLPKWQRIFEGRLGPADKPLGVEPSNEQVRLTEKFGGIRKHQVLFKGNDGACYVLVMFWPWEDKEHVTLKMALCQ